MGSVHDPADGPVEDSHQQRRSASDLSEGSGPHSPTSQKGRAHSQTLHRDQLPNLDTSPEEPGRQLNSTPPDAPIVSPSRAAGLQHDPNYRPGLRRKYSDPRRSFQSEYERPEIQQYSSRRRLRANSDDDRDKDYTGQHPDGRERNRPPRAHRNFDNGFDAYNAPPNTNFNDTRADLERGPDPWPQNYDGYGSRQGSIDGYPERKKRFSGEGAADNMGGNKTWSRILDSNFKNHFVASLGEFFGTTMFLFFAFAGAQVANTGVRAEAASPDFSGTPTFDAVVPLYISFIFGFSLLVNVWIFYRISGAQFNPAVTLALVIVGAVKPIRAVFIFFAQIAGSITASALVLGLFPIPLSVRNSLGSGTTPLQGVFIEAILTAELVFTILMLAKEKHRATFLAPVGIGLALFIAHLVGINFTGSSLNPARSFGPCVVTGTFEEEHWIYWVGPAAGALIAVALYKIFVLLEYEMTNPGQDGDDSNDPTKNDARYREIISRRITKER